MGLLNKLKNKSYQAGYQDALMVVSDRDYDNGYKAGNHAKNRISGTLREAIYNKGQIDAFDEILNHFYKDARISDRIKKYLEKREK